VLDGYDLGVIGVGEIGAAIVTGLCEGTGDAPRILLSPRSAGRAAALAARYPSVTVAPDNQAVADRCAVVVLAVRPADAAAVLGGLNFRAEQAVVSLLAGVPHAELGPLVAPATDIARAIPLPPVSRRAGVTPVHPGTAAALALFGRLGSAVEVDDPGAFDAMSVATGTVAAYLRYVATVSGWLSDQGVPAGQAERYVRSVFAGLADDLIDGTRNLERLAGEHATPGGINERFRVMLEQDGVFRVVRQSLQDIYEGLTAG
jgi:pyrroline-5-carboxylate reductase